MILFILSAITAFILSAFLIFSKKEKWSNTYSGWPGPLESPFRSNIPALYGNPKYESDCNYNYDLRSKSNYLSLKDLPK
jgi:hypothetical protein